MQHDSIMQSSDPDYALVEGEAERVAHQAALALRASRAACYSASSGRPTWTGASGVKYIRQQYLLAQYNTRSCNINNCFRLV